MSKLRLGPADFEAKACSPALIMLGFKIRMFGSIGSL